MQRSHLVPKYGTRWALMWTNSFLTHTHASIRVRFRCPCTRHKSGHLAPVCTRLCNHCNAHVFFFKNYVWQGENGVTMYTVTYRVLTVWTRHHFGPVRRHWFLVNVDSPWEIKQNVRVSRKRLQILHDRITLGFSLSIPFKDFKWYRFLVTGVIEGFWGGWNFRFRVFLVSISFTWGFFAFSKQSEVVIRMLLMKQKKFLGVSGVSFFGGVGGWFLSPFDHSDLSLEIWSSPSPPCLRTGCQKKSCYVYNNSTCICSHEAVNLTKSTTVVIRQLYVTSAQN